MNTKLIELQDGILIEVESESDQVQQISYKFANKIDESIQKLKPKLFQTCHPIINCWKEIAADLAVDSFEIELGLNIEAEGNIFISKAKSGCHFIMRFKFNQT